MATKKISELTETTELNDNDLIVVVDVENDTTKKITKGNLFKAYNGEIQYPTYVNGEDYSSSRRSYYVKNGHIGLVCINIKNLDLSSYSDKTLFQLPEGFRPKYRTENVLVRLGWEQYVEAYIEPNGNVGIYSIKNYSSSNFMGIISYYID